MFLKRKRKTKRKNAENQWKTQLVSRLTPWLFPLLVIYHEYFLYFYCWTVTGLVLPFIWFRAPRSKKNMASPTFFSAWRFVAYYWHHRWCAVALDDLLAVSSEVPSSQLDLLEIMLMRHVDCVRSKYLAGKGKTYLKLSLLSQLFLMWGVCDLNDESVELTVPNTMTFVEFMMTNFGAVVVDSRMLELAKCRVPFDTDRWVSELPLRLVHRHTAEVVDAAQFPLLVYLHNFPCAELQQHVTKQLYRGGRRPDAFFCLFQYNEASSSSLTMEDDYELQLDAARWDKMSSMAQEHFAVLEKWNCGDHWWSVFSRIGSQEDTSADRWVAVTDFAATARLDLATPCLEFVYRLRSASK